MCATRRRLRGPDPPSCGYPHRDDSVGDIAGLRREEFISVALGIVGGRDVAEDVVASVVEECLTREREGQGINFGYLMRATRSRALDEVRNAARRTRKLQVLSARTTFDSPGSGSPEREMEKRRYVAFLNEALVALSCRRREALVLTMIEGLSVAQAAVEMRTTASNVRTLRKRALGDLQTMMKALGIQCLDDIPY